MQLFATIANSLWTASNLPAYLRFRSTLNTPKVPQDQKLRTYLKRNVHTAFGRQHDFGTIRNYKEFVRRVPLMDYDSLEPWIDRIRAGEKNVLSADPVTHLIPTSGSSGARKLIPFTIGLQREFNAAIAPWLVDMQSAGLIGGPAYWSITPLAKNSSLEKSAVPIGFDADTAYLGGARRHFAEAIMAVPSSVQNASSIEAFRYETLFHLLRCRELRLISIWHPSFLTLLLDDLPTHWDNLLLDIRSGRKDSSKPLPRRADELRSIGFCNPKELWLRLRLISCWGDESSAIPMGQLHSRFPNILVQRKGLLATEGVVTIPLAGKTVLAVRSHFFEFLDEAGRISVADEVREGNEYEIVLTTGGGLWRYRLQDRVRVTGFAGKTPALQFIGRAGAVSDRCGEKLSETFVTRAIQAATANLPPPRFALLAPEEDEAGCRYTLYLEGEVKLETMLRLEDLLQTNPQYAWCRELSQLLPPRLFQIKRNGFAAFLARECAAGKRMGDVKPCSLSNQTGWTNYFEGAYLPEIDAPIKV